MRGGLKREFSKNSKINYKLILKHNLISLPWLREAAIIRTHFLRISNTLADNIYHRPINNNENFRHIQMNGIPIIGCSSKCVTFFLMSSSDVQTEW